MSRGGNRRAPCVGVLLAGGAARRFGGLPKGLALLGGVRVADRALAALAEASEEQIVVANDARAAEWFPGRRIVPDAVPGLGPLAGLRAGLEAADGAAMLVIAWDMPFVPGGLLCALREAGEATAADAAVPVHPPGETPEPVCAYYAPAALHLCRALLAGGERRAAAVYENLGTVHRLEGEALRRFGDPARLFTSIDTPAALAAAGGVLDASGV